MTEIGTINIITVNRIISIILSRFQFVQSMLARDYFIQFSFCINCHINEQCHFFNCSIYISISVRYRHTGMYVNSCSCGICGESNCLIVVYHVLSVLLAVITLDMCSF